MDEQQVIAQTRQWIKVLVIGCNFCPFAARAMEQHSIHYQVETGTSFSAGRKALQTECERLDNDASIGTTLIIFPTAFPEFDEYLQFLAYAEKQLHKNGYEGIYQLASFHPLYRFAGSAFNDAANYTNRSIYPMLHLLREESIRKALEFYPHSAAGIPENNIHFAREKGTAYMKLLRDSCL
ncbi:MAG TPA: DUF1415 domain-containing protein [Chitinophaga sp.]|uniref:DUF1415 domain-containing protein n=1 Tax=Chitinophaga sp. TaxID=1869181 RepID=UPI002F934C12